MAKARLLQAACAAALLAAAPAFAQQSTTQPADTGAGGSVNAPVTHDSSAPNGATSQPKAAPADKMGSASGSGTSASSGSQPTRRSAMNTRSSGPMHGRSDASQNAAVDQLNDQSYRAAHSGQAFSASGTGSSGSMSDMSGGSAGSPAGAASGSGGGAGGSGGGSGK